MFILSPKMSGFYKKLRELNCYPFCYFHIIKAELEIASVEALSGEITWFSVWS